MSLCIYEGRRVTFILSLLHPFWVVIVVWYSSYPQDILGVGLKAMVEDPQSPNTPHTASPRVGGHLFFEATHPYNGSLNVVDIIEEGQRLSCRYMSDKYCDILRHRNRLISKVLHDSY